MQSKMIYLQHMHDMKHYIITFFFLFYKLLKIFFFFRIKLVLPTLKDTQEKKKKKNVGNKFIGPKWLDY
jgi:hypothetical protein